MANRLQGEPALQPLSAQFVLLKIDTGLTPIWNRWQNRYECEGSGIPKVYVVRADGKQIYGKSGAPKPLDVFLKRRLEDAGTVLNASELAEIENALKKTQRAIRRKDVPEAVELVAEYSDTGSYAAAARTMDQLADEFENKAQQALEGAEEKLTSDDEKLNGAIELVELQRDYQKLPDFKDRIASTLETYREDEQHKQLIAQAKLMVQARDYEAERQWKQALASYREIETNYPDGPAVELARPKISELEDRADASSSKQPPAENSVADAKRAASLLRLGKLLMKKRPDKAPDYFRKAIKLAPDSEAAQEARKLLDELE